MYVLNVLCLVAQLYPTLCDPMDCSLLGSSVHGGSSGRNIGVDCHALQGIFRTQGLNPGLPQCRQILYRLSHQGFCIGYKISNGGSFFTLPFCLFSSVQSLSHVQLFATLWIAACQASLSLFQYPIILPFHTVHGVLKARILKWFAIPFSSGPHSVIFLYIYIFRQMSSGLFII